MELEELNEKRNEYTREGYKLFKLIGYKKGFMMQLLNAISSKDKGRVLSCVSPVYISQGLNIPDFFQGLNTEDDFSNLYIYMIGLSGTNIDDKEKRSDYMTAQEVADYLRLDKETVYNKIKSGDILAKKTGKNYLIKKTDVEEYLKK